MRFLLVVVTLGLLLAGCSTPGPDNSPAASSASPAAASAPLETRTVDVILQGKQFVNSTVTIYAGDTVRWTHLDGTVGHSVMSDDMAFSSNDACMNELMPHPLCMNNGDTFQQTFDKAGTATYHCHAHHDTMKGKIIVVARPA
ncbi:MAG: plastocyanin/azurin family copper-binding protein [bacterium]